MTIKGLWNELKEHKQVKEWDASKLDGRWISVDLASWLFHSKKRDFGGDSTYACKKLIFERLFSYCKYGLNAVAVLDGPCNVKKKKAGDRKTWRELREVAVVFKAFGYPVFEAPGEAEALCSALVNAGLCDYVLSSDSDCLIYQETGVILKTVKLSWTNPRYNLIETCCIDEAASSLGLTQKDGFKKLASIAGCDFGTGLKGYGMKKAIKYLKKNGKKELPKEAKTLLQDLDDEKVKATEEASKLKKKYEKLIWQRPTPHILQESFFQRKFEAIVLEYDFSQKEKSSVNIIKYDRNKGRYLLAIREDDDLLKQSDKTFRKSLISKLKPANFISIL